MKSIKRAIIGCVYTLAFFILIALLDTYIPHHWIFGLLSIHGDSVIHNRGDSIYYSASFIFALLINSVFVALTAKPASIYINTAGSRGSVTPKGKLKLLLTWYVFFAIYIVILFLIFLGLPEVWFHELIMGDRHVPCDNPEWNEIYGSLVLALSLPISGVVVAFTPALAMKVSNELKRWRRSTG